MTKPTAIRFEATEITVDVFDGTALLTIQTVLSGRVVVHMQRAVLVDLAAGMQHVLGEEQPPADRA